MPVHVFGHIGNMAALQKLAEDHHLTLIEDAAEALGSTKHGTHAGLFGCCGALSFNGNKIITTGGGGAIITNDDALADRLEHVGPRDHDELDRLDHRVPEPGDIADGLRVALYGGHHNGGTVRNLRIIRRHIFMYIGHIIPPVHGIRRVGRPFSFCRTACIAIEAMVV